MLLRVIAKNIGDVFFETQCSNGHPILYRFEVIADCCLNFGHIAFYIKHFS